MQATIQSKATLEAQLEKNTLTLVDFYADWCGPCQMIASYWGELKEEFSEQVTFVKVNVEEEKELARAYGVSALPTMKFFHGKEEGEEIRGAVPKALLAHKIKQKLS